MAGLGFKDFQVGEVLTSADVDGYLMQQSVMRFADAGARGSALGTATGTGVPLAEGMVSYLDDDNAVSLYDSSGWVRVDGPGIGSNLVDGSIYTPVATTSTADVTSLSITPTSAASKVLVIASGILRITGQNTVPKLYLTDNANTVLYQGDAAGSRSRASWGMTLANITNAEDFATMSFAFTALHSPATTSAFTYKLRVASTGGSTTRVGTSSTGDADSSFTTRVPTTFIAVEVMA